MHTKFMLLLLTVLMSASVISAQDAETTEEAPQPLPIAPQIVEVDADDGLDLVADFYLVDPARPTVILLHELYTDRTSWDALLLPLLANNYNILVPDLRGWGDTRGAINWFNAVDDMAVWFTWLRDEAGVNPDAIHTAGSSMGSTLAIVGCGLDDLCVSAIAISPGWSYYRISVEDTIATRPIMAIFAQNDRYPSLGVPQMIEAAPDTLTVIEYEGNAHGMDLLAQQQELIVVQMIEWLNTH